MPHVFDPVILREYDIRGTVGKTLGAADAAALGRAFGTLVTRAGGRLVAVGYDGRVHSPELEQALVEGLMAMGMEVVRVGLGPTPMLYFATGHLKADAGIMVTGSHNPPDQNGFKMLIASRLPGGGPVYGERIRELGALAASGLTDVGFGTERFTDIREDYVNHLLVAYKNPQPFRIVWDCGNGATGEIVQMLTLKLPGEHILLFDRIDGRFPNHKPDPSNEENLRALKETVRETRADLGIAFDGDGDRIGVVDRQGRAMAGDRLLALYAADILKREPGATVIADVKSSQMLFDRVAAWGGKPIMWKTGHALIKTKMNETGAAVAGEMSGHMFFADNHNFDDALYAAMRLLAILAASGMPLAQWADRLPGGYSTGEMRFPVEEIYKFSIVDGIKARLKQEGAEIIDIDGVRVKNEDGWWLLRPSNTEAILVARAEGKDAASLGRLVSQIEKHLRENGLIEHARQAS